MSAQNPISILLVEDDVPFRELLETLLLEEGYLVIAAGSGEEALEKAQSSNYDLVVTDVKLGGIDGLDTLTELKRGRSELQSLVITGYATEADSIRAISLGVGNYLKKPFNLPDFLRAVNEIAKQILVERDLSEFKQAALKTGLWGLETLSRINLTEEGEKLRETALAAERVALAQGLSARAGRQIRLAVLASGQEGSLKGIPFLLRILPDHTRWLLANIEGEAKSKSEDLEIARFALNLLQEGGNSELGLDSDLETAFQAKLKEPAESEAPSEEPKLGQYLALAKAMEVSGDIGAASRIMQELGEADLSSQALLYQARVNWLKGDNQKASKLLEQAREICPNLSERCKISLEGGVLLAQMGQLEKATTWLEEAVSGFEDLQNPTERSRALLALQAAAPQSVEISEEALELLLQPHQLESLLSSAHWLFPHLIKLSDHQLADRALIRIARDAPHAVSRCLLDPKLSLEQRLRGLHFVEQVGIEGYDDLLQELMLDTEASLREKAESLLQNQDSMRVAPILRIYALGSMSTWLGERRVPDKGWTGSKPFYLINYLAQQSGRFVSHERLLDLFWHGTARANKNLNQCLVVMRNALRSPDWPDRIDYVERRGSMIGLSEENRIWHDASLLFESLEKAETYLRDDNRRRAADFYQQALELDRGEYLPTCYEDWAIDFRENLNLKLVRGLSTLAEIRVSQNRPAEALPVFEKILTRDPFHEPTLQAQFQAYLDLERPLEVLKLYDRLEDKMRLELELEPPMELVKLYHMAKLKL